jgi:hypothetical protein
MRAVRKYWVGYQPPDKSGDPGSSLLVALGVADQPTVDWPTSRYSIIAINNIK